MISIAVTTYNGEKYLQEQLDSILNQTYSDFELVICDDCSSDSTVKILNEYKEKDLRIKVFTNEKNLGFKKNFEKAISFCNGDYIAFSDQDDVWNKNKLELSISEIGNNSLLCTNSELTDSNLNPLGYSMSEVIKVPNDFSDKTELLKILLHGNFVQGATILAKSNFIKKYLPIPENIIFHDWYFALCAELENGIKYLSPCTMKYRQHISNVTENNKKGLCETLKVHHYNKEKFKKDIMQSLCFVQLIKSNTKDAALNKYLDETKKYFISCYYAKFSALAYFNKYFAYFPNGGGKFNNA